MRHLIRFCLYLVLIGFFLGCTKDSDPVIPAPVLSINKDSIHLPFSAGRDTIQINSNSNWSISNIPAWITISPTKGSGNIKVVVSYFENFTSNVRSDYVLIKTDSVNTSPKQSQFKIIQDQRPVKIFNDKLTAQGGATLIINGSGFSKISTENIVSINGTTATVTNADTNRLSVTVPMSVGTGKIKIVVNTQSVETNFLYIWSGVATYFAGSSSAQSRLGGFDFDSEGNLYIADYNRGRVEKVTPSGVMTSMPGHTNMSDNQYYNLPTDVAVDASGNVFVAEYNHGRISKISKTGQVSTIIQEELGSINNIDGNTSVARIRRPSGIVVDVNGNVLITATNSIRKIASGVVSTLAGTPTPDFSDGTGSNARFNFPSKIVIDKNGDYIVSDRYNNKIRKVSPGGVVTTVVSSGLPGPNDIAIDKDGNFYIACIDGKIFRYSVDGGLQAFPVNVSFAYLEGIGFDKNGTLYVADHNTGKIYKVTIQ